MKILLLLAVIGLSGCGLQRQVDELKNREAQSEADSQARDAALQAQIQSLEADRQFDLLQLSAQGLLLANVQIDVNASATQIQSILTTMNDLQASINAQTEALAILQGYTNIVSIKDPCGAQSAYNEVFLKLSTGQYLASFSDSASGLNTRFTILTDGSFVTTDGSHCYFTVSNGGTVISNEHN